MMKNYKTKFLFCLLIFFLSASNSFTQNYLINQNFTNITGTTPPVGWSNNMLSGVSAVDNWAFGKHPKFFFAPPFDNNYAIFDSYNGGSAGGTASNGSAENVAFESPSVNTVGLSNLYMSFDFMTLYNGGVGNFEISTNGGTSWTLYANWYQVTAVPQSILWDFSSYIGYSNFKVRFRWDNTSNYTYSGYLAIDNVKLYERYATDASIVALAPMYDKSCPSATQPVNIEIRNQGSNTLTNIPVTVNVTGATTTTLTYTYVGSLAANSSVSVNVGNISTMNGGNVNFTAIVNYSGDTYQKNDTFRTTRVSAAIASNPTAIPGSACGSGSRVTIGATRNTGDSTFWYSQATGGNIIGSGTPFQTPPINGTRDFYAQNAQLFNNDQSAFQGPYRFNGIQFSGSYFNVSTINDVLIDSFWQHFAYAGPYTVYVYYKTGTYSGFESNQSAWTLYDTKSITSTGYGHMVNIKLRSPLSIPAGTTYGFYIMVDGLFTNKCITFKNATLTHTNADMSVATGVVSNGSFTGVSGGYSWDGRIFYRKLCLSGRVAVKATIKPRPIGSSIADGSPFQGQVKVGDVSNPDIIEVGKTITYNVAPPTGHTNATHSSTWKITGFVVRTKSGQLVPASEYTTTLPSGSSPATITFKPKSVYLDSVITFSMNFSDLGPNFCDSTVKRSVVIAPTPKPNFKVPAFICLGDELVIENQTTIHSGNSTYMWYFGNGDSSDLQNPIYTYKTPGSYNIRLVAKSFPWNVMKDTTITVEVRAIPTAKFKANNQCQGAAVTFVNQTTGGSGTLTYDWDFGDNSAHSTLQNPSRLYAAPGAYIVTLTATAVGCKSVISKNAYLFHRPVANFIPAAATCAKSEVILPNTSTIGSGDQGAYWTFGDGGNSTLFDGNHMYNAPGTYSVKLLAVSAFDCKDSITKSVTIKPSPIPNFNGNQFCGKIPTTFTNNSVEAIINPVYKWTFSDGYTSSLKNVTRTWPYEGPFTATLKSTYGNGCEGSITKDFNVLIQPKADFTVDDICSGENAIFVNKTKGDKGGIEYNWDFGNNGTSNLPAPIREYKPATTQTYVVTLIASYPAGCSDTVRRTVTASESPICDFSMKDMGFLNFKFTPANSGYVKYEWFFGEGGTAVSPSPNYQYLYAGNFAVTMKATNLAGCTCEITKTASATTAVHSLNNINGISIYPNPNTGTFTITNADNQGMKIEIFNVLGSKVYGKSTTDGNLIVNLQDQAKGIYLVKVTVNGVTSTTKITVTN